MNGWWRFNTTTLVTTFSLGRRVNSIGPYKTFEILQPARTTLLADAVTIVTNPQWTSPASNNTYTNDGYNGYTSIISYLGNDRTYGNQQSWSQITGLPNTGLGSGTWRIGKLTHEGGPNILYWDGHAAHHRYTRTAHPIMDPKMLTANYSGVTQDYLKN